MPLNQELTPTTVTIGDGGHADLHTQERTLLNEVRQVANQAIGSFSTISGNTAMGFDYLVKDWTLTGNATIGFAAGPVGESGQAVTITLRLKQDGTGGRSVTWVGAPTLKWPGGSPPALTTGAGREDWLVFTTFDNGVTWVGALAMKDVR